MSRVYHKSEELLDRALKVIPLASQTFSKSITQYPVGVSPLFIAKGDACRVWDVDGNEFIDLNNGLAAVTLGHNYAEVTKAVVSQIERGTLYPLPHPLEVEVAELISELVPSAEMVRFGKNGSDATSAAIRLARAYTGRDHVLVCGYHGWQDWYIGSTSRYLGVPECVRQLTHSFQYNSIDSLLEKFSALQGRVAAVIMEPMNVFWPSDNFLSDVKEATHDNGAVLIFDETVTGFRFSRGGAQELFGVTPDLTTLGKGLANGMPLSAVVGKRDIMMLMEDIFFSGTFGGETASLSAAKVVLSKIRDGDVSQKLAAKGEAISGPVERLIESHGLGDILAIRGHPSWKILCFSDAQEQDAYSIKTLYLQEMFKRGVLTIGSHNISYTLGDEEIEKVIQVYDEVLGVVSEALKNSTFDTALSVPPLKPLFKIR